MNRRLLIFTLAIATLAVFVWWFSNRSSSPSIAQAQVTPAPVPPAAPTPVAPAPPVRVAYEVPAGGAYEGLSDPRWQWWNAMKKVDRSFEWKMPISFYGRVIDQDDQPIPDAGVQFVWNDTSPRGTSKAETTSDTTGRFSLLNQKGKGLSVYVTKDGYHTSGGKGGQGFEYAAFFEGIYHRPDPANPVTFRLVKKLDAEPLIARRVAERTTYDRPSYYDLERGALTQQPPAGAALKLTFERSESPQGQPFDWKWKVEAVNGALVETKDEFAQVAPEEGYMPAWETSQAANAQSFRKNGQAKFYVRTTDNRFAMVNVELAHPNLRSVGPRLTVNSFLNPSGSRNLEYDPSKQAAAR